MTRITVSGTDIRVTSGGTVIVDGKEVQSGLQGNIEVIVEGDCRTVDAAGSVRVKGNVLGSIDAGGSVQCGPLGVISMWATPCNVEMWAETLMPAVRLFVVAAK